ncbi:hypothetical protein V8E53_003800, partial [Lactarius tabidus]
MPGGSSVSEFNWGPTPGDGGAPTSSRRLNVRHLLQSLAQGHAPTPLPKILPLSLSKEEPMTNVLYNTPLPCLQPYK